MRNSTNLSPDRNRGENQANEAAAVLHPGKHNKTRRVGRAWFDKRGDNGLVYPPQTHYSLHISAAQDRLYDDQKCRGDGE